MKKRANGEGSVHQIQSGSWRASVTIEGRKVSKVYKTQKEALQWLRETNRRIDEGSTLSQELVSAYLRRWLEDIGPSRRVSTMDQYVQVVEQYLLPSLGDIKLANLKSGDIQQMLRSLTKHPHLTLKVRDVLHSALEQAVKTGLIPRNPVDNTIVPQPPRREMNVWTEEECRTFTTSLRGHRWEALFYLALTTGARQMELLGLQWGDVDWGRSALHIQRQLSRHGGFSPLKTEYSRRTVTIGNMDMLQRRMTIQDEECARATRWMSGSLIFTTKNGTAISPRNLQDDFKELSRKAGVPAIRFHDMRHTAATIMLNHGIPVIVVSRRLGHSRPSITLNIYGHYVPSMQEEAAQVMERLVEEG